ncbi:restriction endonuclease [Streptomyces sp. WMMB303]|uniref:restriction endonuclease n=1 Tax=Streptomyces sp. WMMB303 TaxID=3034154 RepID=UPI00320813D9
MRRDGCEAERLGGAGDDACDVRAVDPAGRVWAIQCKHRRDGERGAAVGTGVLQQVNGTARQVHKADIAVVLTNGRFSSKAIPWGKQHDIQLVDRRLLGEWAAGSRPLWELLGRIPPPHRPTALS